MEKSNTNWLVLWIINLWQKLTQIENNRVFTDVAQSLGQILYSIVVLNSAFVFQHIAYVGLTVNVSRWFVGLTLGKHCLLVLCRLIIVCWYYVCLSLDLENKLLIRCSKVIILIKLVNVYITWIQKELLMESCWQVMN